LHQVIQRIDLAEREDILKRPQLLSGYWDGSKARS